MPWLNKRWISFFVFSTVAAFVLVCVVGWANNREANKRQNKFDSYGVDPDGDISGTDWGTNWTGQALVGIVNVNYFDANGRTGPAFGVQVTYVPILNLTSAVAALAPAVPIQIIAAQKTTNFSANVVLPKQPYTLDVSGNPNSYPFDSYDTEITISASVLSTDDGLPLTMFVEGAVQGFVYTTHFQGSSDGSAVTVSFNVQRSTTTRIFVAIVFLLMWFLSLSIFVAAMSVWFRGKNTELPLVAISTALLFALPNIRNSQPGVPSPVGTTEDMVGFFWNILLVAISAISLLIKWILQNKRPGPPPALTAVRTDLESVEKPLKSGQ